MPKIFFKRSAEEDLAKLPKHIQEQVAVRIRQLAEHGQRCSGLKKLKTKPYYRLRSGDYRIVYVIEGNDEFTIHLIRNRKDVYKHLGDE